MLAPCPTTYGVVLWLHSFRLAPFDFDHMFATVSKASHDGLEHRTHHLVFWLCSFRLEPFDFDHMFATVSKKPSKECKYKLSIQGII